MLENPHAHSREGAVSKMLENMHIQKGEPLARCSKQAHSRGGAVSKMLENTRIQEGEPLARCSQTRTLKRGSNR